jgi:hypothetical protein
VQALHGVTRIAQQQSDDGGIHAAGEGDHG